MNHDLYLFLSCASIVIGAIGALVGRIVKLSPKFEKVEPFISFPLIVVGAICALLLVIYKNDDKLPLPYPVATYPKTDNKTDTVEVPEKDVKPQYALVPGVGLDTPPIKRTNDSVTANFGIIVYNNVAIKDSKFASRVFKYIENVAYPVKINNTDAVSITRNPDINKKPYVSYTFFDLFDVKKSDIVLFVIRTSFRTVNDRYNVDFTKYFIMQNDRISNMPDSLIDTLKKHHYSN